mmetsp:Transcript_26921/g.65444  ORF Transcript_26921/g.65444 Transcript_26921/m.65444 type:complete len:312 (-) Transcript_26921:89-1024(-)
MSAPARKGSTRISLAENARILAAGATAGAVSRTATAPLERLKIMRQVSHMVESARSYHDTGLVASLVRFYREDGVRGFFKGNGTNCVKVVPASAIRFLAFENYKLWLMAPGATSLPSQHKLLAGSAAGVTAVAATYPLDLLRTRLSLGDARTLRATIANVLRADGPVGLYRGVGTAMVSTAPFSALNFTFYEIIKEAVARAYARRVNSDRRPHVLLSAAYGAASGALSMTTLYPLDVIKRSLMAVGMTRAADKQYRHGGDAARGILRDQGVRGFYRGILPSYLKVIPTVSLTFTSYELLKRWFNVERRRGG